MLNFLSFSFSLISSSFFQDPYSILSFAFLFYAILWHFLDLLLNSCFLLRYLRLSFFVLAASSRCLFASSLLSSFLSLDSYPVLFLPFLPSASDALGSIQRRGSGSCSVAAIVERRFYNESLYLGKRLRLSHCASRNCCSLSLGAKCSGDARRTIGAVSKAFCVLLSPDALRNAFAEYFRSYEMRIV